MEKNFGSIALVPLYEKSNDNNELKSKLKFFKSLGDFNNKSKAKASSISNSWLNEALSIVSSVPIENKEDIDYKDYVVFPKEIKTANIPPPIEISNGNLGKIRAMRLLYSHSDQLIAEGRVNLNEPFRTPLIQFVLNNITGYGAPDYPHSLQEVINSKKLEE